MILILLFRIIKLFKKKEKEWRRKKKREKKSARKGRVRGIIPQS
jgi:hypothetical protein